MKPEFRRSSHTIVISDIHLTDAQIPIPKKPLWKRYKYRTFFVDATFERFLKHVQEIIPNTSSLGVRADPIELILNGDIFDFDSVMAIPEKPDFHVSWLERARGLAAEEAKSRFKMATILKDHHLWVKALREFILNNNKVVFVIGNHDIELHWPGVQAEILEFLDLPENFRGHVRFCEWFYISNHDTLIEHGNQYDAYTLCSNPIHPLIKKGTKIHVRIPFGDLANKFMMNGMGLFNPYVQSAFILTFKEYVKFFFTQMLKQQPMLLWTWFWGSMMTLGHSLLEGFLPAVKDPLTVERRIAEIAYKSNASPRVVRSLKEIHVHPAYYNPLKILRELWLDRALLFMLIFFASIQIISFLRLFANVDIAWALIPFGLLMPFFVFYARSIKSDYHEENIQAPIRSVTLSSRLAKTKRVIHGHTHFEAHRWIDGVELLNTGTWSPGFHDAECTQPFGRKPFVWLKPNANGPGRVAELREWKDPESVVIAPEATEPVLEATRPQAATAQATA